MIFIDPMQDAENDEEFTGLGKYHPYDNRQNPLFDAWSGFILDIKSGDEQENLRGARHFFHELNAIIAPGIVIAVVPSSTVGKLKTGIRFLAEHIAKQGRIDGTGCLVRFQDVAKAATGGPRDVQVHLDSIRVEQQSIFGGREVLILDDVTTSGGSFTACRQLLLGHGAARVKCLALGKTFRQ